MRWAIGAFAILILLTGCTSSSPAEQSSTPAPTTSSAPSTPPTSPTTHSSSAPRATHASSAPTPHPLPLDYSTGSAGQVLTVVAASHSSTTATLQAWQRSSDHRWTAVGPAVHAWLGSGGIGHASEGSPVTPEGSFTMTQAFGRYADPGTALPYRRTTSADWWISQPGRLYNTEQHCSSNCPFAQGDPNEHLYYAMPFYEYAVVVNYNRDPAVPGAGSAFFLHVTVGEPTQGCVSINRDQLVRIMRWLDPAQHPRILMGVG